MTSRQKEIPMGLFRTKTLLQFLCEPADKDVIAPPVPAKAYSANCPQLMTPSWRRTTPA
jgi:hypothetical protein